MTGYKDIPGEVDFSENRAAFSETVGSPWIVPPVSHVTGDSACGDLGSISRSWSLVLPPVNTDHEHSRAAVACVLFFFLPPTLLFVGFFSVEVLTHVLHLKSAIKWSVLGMTRVFTSCASSCPPSVGSSRILTPCGSPCLPWSVHSRLRQALPGYDPG